uniref:Uncharacterized protein n=1 Tax=Arundo donax TaxID=35708 RepID=A0A0A9HIF2_ARUDO
MGPGMSMLSSPCYLGSRPCACTIAHAVPVGFCRLASTKWTSKHLIQCPQEENVQYKGYHNVVVTGIIFMIKVCG